GDSMLNRNSFRTTAYRLTVGGIVIAAAATGLAGCAPAADGGDGGDEPIRVALIVKTNSNPFFVAMNKGAEAAAKDAGVSLTLAAGKDNGDEATQIQAIEDAIARGDQGILITPAGAGVNDAIKKARDAGIFVIALDSPTDPPDVVDITFATDNRLAGKLIGEWTAAQLDGKKAVIGLLDGFDDVIISVDYERDQGFLAGMGIAVGDDKVRGDEASTGSYSGGDYEIVGSEVTKGAEDAGVTGMEKLLAINPNINVVYAINEPSADGAVTALTAAGANLDDVLVVAIDGGCAGVQSIVDGNIDATSQQYPVKMAELGVKAIVDLVKNGTKPAVTDGLDFFNTGVALVTDNPAAGVDSIDTGEGSKLCW
ncbi:MAG: substrate-binding domain-containing protein, partial [Caldimonas sp.]